MEKTCGTCVHCADRHGHYLTNDGVCLRIGVSVKKDTPRHGCAPCGIRWDGEVGEYGPDLWEERTDALEQRYQQLEQVAKSMLEPCPFCNSERITGMTSNDESRLYREWVCCEDCGASTTTYEMKAQAVEAWNTRYKRTCKMQDALNVPDSDPFDDTTDCRSS